MSPKDKAFRQRLEAISDKELIDLCSDEISKMCKSGGRSFTMTIPCNIKDSDILLSEMIRRFRGITNSLN